MTVLSLMRNRLRDTEKLLKIRTFSQQNTEKEFWRLAAHFACKIRTKYGSSVLVGSPVIIIIKLEV